MQMLPMIIIVMHVPRESFNAQWIKGDVVEEIRSLSAVPKVTTAPKMNSRTYAIGFTNAFHSSIVIITLPYRVVQESG